MRIPGVAHPQLRQRAAHVLGHLPPGERPGSRHAGRGGGPQRPLVEIDRG